MFPEDGCLWVYGVGEDGVTAFTKDGIENLRQIIADETSRRPRTAGGQIRPNSPACGAHRMLTSYRSLAHDQSDPKDIARSPKPIGQSMAKRLGLGW